MTIKIYSEILGVITVLTLLTTQPTLASHQKRTGPPTPSTCFWAEPEFHEFPTRGPNKAVGVVLWSHGQKGNQQSWKGGAPKVIRIFAEKGWDVFLIQRNGNCAGNWNKAGYSYVRNMASEAEKFKKEGYKKIILAGQSVGAGTALGASETSKVDGVIAFALSHGRSRCRRDTSVNLYHSHYEHIQRGIRGSASPRILISLGKDDHCLGNSFTPMVTENLEQKKISYIYLDEKSGIEGHYAANSSGFRQRFGNCIYGFFTSDKVAPGRKNC